ncbi:hypothetical protein [Paenibacillus durus]|uniref:Uncharacterized protein n=1 Tax=Paenibacillus durus ATCC 35681 TaxID=1333534 RepID=A0A0F7FBL6_PAEDU|nr:hypothetical protein [Paenibacillus durus]AKG36073.1 hypothetical protein VK70_17165 [Paenibacillus durus ATCC 35681]
MSEKAAKTQKLYKPTVEARELAERLFKESGIEFEGDFFAHVMTTYELQQMKNGLGAGYQKQISSLEYHMKSVLEHFTSMLQTEHSERTQLADGYEEKVTGLAAELSIQQDEIAELNNMLKEAAEQSGKLIDDNTELRKYTANIENLNAKNEEILAENKERIERLSKMVADAQDAVIQKQELEARISEISKISEKQAEELAAERKAAEALESAQEERVKQLSEQHKDELERAAERSEIAQEKAILAAERKHSEEVRKLYDEMDKLRQQLAEAKQPKK